MSITKFILRSLWYFKKQHLAILLGTILSTAILTGALIIGDSVNYSLNQIVGKRLGNAAYALMTGDRFVRKELADVLGDYLKLKTTAILSVEGISINPETNARVNKSFVYGIDDSFWSLSNLEPIPLANSEAIISSNLAQKLMLNVGDQFLLRVENVDFIPLNSPFIEEEQASVALRLTVKEIVEAEKMGRFSLKSNQVAPNNVFVSNSFLSDRLELGAFVNTILVEDSEDKLVTTDFLNKKLGELWTIADAGLILKDIQETNQFEILSKRIFMDESIDESLSSLDLKNEKILTYLVNSLRSNGKTTPYSFVTAASFLFNNEQLKENEIVVNSWLAKDLGISVSDTLTLDYFTIGSLRTLIEKSASFVVKQIVETGKNGLDNSLMPAFPGLADANSCSDWETSIPIDLTLIQDEDEDYWNKFRGTPKAYISLEKGAELWKSSFGTYTAMRFNKQNVDAKGFESQVLAQLKPMDIGMQFIPVREQGSQAANNGVGFGELFLSLSFFVILAGILLTALLYSLNAESRKSESGLLSAFGFTRKQVLKIQFFESFFIALLGGILGAFMGVLYNYGIMQGIQSIWSDIVRTNDLVVFIKPSTILMGAFSGLIIALLVVYFVARKKLKVTLVYLLKNSSFPKLRIKKTKFWVKISTFTSLGGSLLLLIYSIFGVTDMNPGLLMMAGALFMFGGIALSKWVLSKSLNGSSIKPFGIKMLALKNAALNQGRSIAVIALLALGSFTILITGANRKTFYDLDNSNASGTGGYLHWAESTMPILKDLNELEHEEMKSGISFVQFHNLEGDDASCLNLNLVNKPQLLGVNSAAFDQKQAFSFAQLSEDVDTEHPWLALKEVPDDGIIPAYVDLTVLTWGLKKKVGDTLLYLSESGEPLSLVIKGGLNSSIFQGNVLIEDELFRKHYPSIGGSKIMLIDAPADKQKEIEDYLSDNFTDFGIEIGLTTDRLAEFNSVTNTYLTVFMVLGGLGVLIGTIGLGIVLLRNLLDRRHEIALMQALGFNKSTILKIIFFENFVLLVTGLVIGVLAAFIGILPSLLSSAFDISGGFVFFILAAVFISGVAWIYFPAQFSLNRYLIQSLAGE